MISIAMFNNKGGVGKTTLTCNMASFFAGRRLRTLVVDCDPQCNATQLIMGESFSNDFYWASEQKDNTTTIRSVLRPIEDGDSQIASEISPILGSRNRFNVDLIPGHPGFSVVEDRLSAAWHDLMAGDIGGFRKTSWNTFLAERLSDRYDLILYDLGPSLGSINRCVLLGCDYFVTPMGADIFSILGVRNIASWIDGWLGLYRNSIDVANQRNPGRLSEFRIGGEPKIATGFAGYTMQQYITKSKEGVRIPTERYEEILKLVPTVISDSLSKFLAPGVSVEAAHLGDVPQLYSLIPLAQSVSSPILSLKASDGLLGSQYRQRDEYERRIALVCDRLASNTGMAKEMK